MKRLILALLLLTSLGCMRTASVMGQGAVMPQIYPFRTATGAVASGYKVCFFATGTTTPQAIYSNRTLTTAITQPVTLDSGGYPSVSSSRVQIFYQPLGYKVILYTAGTNCASMSGSANWTIDPSFDYGQEVEAAIDATVAALPTFASGTFTPTCTAITNLASDTEAVHMYMRVGSTVMVHGLVTVDPTAGSAVTSMRCTLPIASDTSPGNRIRGNGHYGNVGSPFTLGITTGANDEAYIDWYTGTDHASASIYLSYMYSIH